MNNKQNNVVSIFLFLYFFPISQEKPFVIDDMEYCSYPLNGKQNQFIEANSKIFQVKFERFQISFKLCKTFHNTDICADGLVACLKHFQGEQEISFGDTFISERNQLKTTNGHKCTETQNYSLEINYSQEGPENPAPLPTKDKCTFSIAIRLPTYSSTCGTYIYGKYMDLSSLAKTFKVHTETRNFSVTLCSRDPTCKQEDVNACEFTGPDTMTPISLLSTLKPFYDGNIIGFKGVTYKGPNKKFDKRFTVLLKCDWDKNEVHNDDLTYNKVETQGRKYSFQLETSYGCLKIPKSCVLKYDSLVYNLTGVNAEFGVAWPIKKGFSEESFFLIQMCGAADLRGKNKSCKNPYAQVCENINGTDLNRGSLLNQLEVRDDVIVATIDQGTKCYNNNQEVYANHKTIIHFFCDFEDYGPKVVSHANSSCEIYFHWRTPKACPKHDVSGCTHIRKANHSCLFYSDKNYYDLSSLTSTKVVANRHRNLEFKFNVCESVLDSDAPCTKDVSVVRKNLTQPNIKFRFTSLGKYSENVVTNDNLVLKFRTGEYCKGAQGEYRSEIHFECKDVEEKPILRKEEMCYYEFLWKTPVACPHPLNHKYMTDASCIFTDHINMKSFNFGNIKAMEFISRHNITFDICARSYKLCQRDTNECLFVELKNITAVFTKTVNKLEIMLDKNCSSSNDFNRFTLLFFCEPIRNNNHFSKSKNNNCSVTITYFTDIVCPLKDDSDNNNVRDLESSKEKVLNEFESVAITDTSEMVKTCHIKSPYTQCEINRQNLPNQFFRLNCPVAIFNNTFRFVKLIYFTNDKCLLIPSKNISYEVYLTCSSTIKLPLENSGCLVSSLFQNLEYCDMFKDVSTEPQGETDVLLIVGTVISGLFLLGLLVFLVFRKRNIFLHTSQTVGFLEGYEKDTQL